MATYLDKLVVYNGGSINKIAAGDTLQVTGNFHIEDGAYDLDIKSHDGTNGLKLAGSIVSSTAAELNLVDGSSAGTIVNSKAVIYGASGEVNATTLQIAGTSITSTASELNILSGVTATAAELNLLDGVTASTTELNYLDVTTLGTSEASKVVTVDANGDLIVPDGDKFQFGSGSDMVVYHDGTNAYITNATGALKLATETSGIAITIGHTTSEVTIGDNLTVTGDLTVNGTTTTVNSTITTLDDPILTLGGDTAPTSDDNKDRGIEFRYYDSQARLGFMGWDDSAAGFTLLKDATNSSEVFSGTAADLVVGGLTTTGITLGGTAISASADEINLLDATAGSSVALAGQDGFIINDASDSNATKKVLISDLSTFFSSSGTVTANNIATGTSAVEITTSTGDIVVDAPTGQSVDLQVNGSNVIEVAGGRVDVSQPLIMLTAGVSLTPAAAHPAIAVGNILAFEAGANGGLELADCDDTATNYLNAPFGVALEASAENATSAIMVHTVHGGIVNVVLASGTTTQGQWVYLSSTAGTATTTAPSSGMVWRLGLSTEHNGSAVTDVDIIWMPQFIADLG